MAEIANSINTQREYLQRKDKVLKDIFKKLKSAVIQSATVTIAASALAILMAAIHVLCTASNVYSIKLVVSCAIISFLLIHRKFSNHN